MVSHTFFMANSYSLSSTHKTLSLVPILTFGLSSPLPLSQLGQLFGHLHRPSETMSPTFAHRSNPVNSRDSLSPRTLIGPSSGHESHHKSVCSPLPILIRKYFSNSGLRSRIFLQVQEHRDGMLSCQKVSFRMR